MARLNIAGRPSMTFCTFSKGRTMKRMRIIIEVETGARSRQQFNRMALDMTQRSFAEVVYLATEIADENETASGNRSWVEPLVIKP